MCGWRGEQGSTRTGLACVSAALFRNAPRFRKLACGAGAGREEAGGFVKFRPHALRALAICMEILGSPRHLARAPLLTADRELQRPANARVAVRAPPRHVHLPLPVPAQGLRAPGVRSDAEPEVGKRGRQVGAQSTRREDRATASLLKLQKEAVVSCRKIHG